MLSVLILWRLKWKLRNFKDMFCILIDLVNRNKHVVRDFNKSTFSNSYQPLSSFWSLKKLLLNTAIEQSHQFRSELIKRQSKYCNISLLLFDRACLIRYSVSCCLLIWYSMHSREIIVKCSMLDIRLLSSSLKKINNKWMEKRNTHFKQIMVDQQSENRDWISIIRAPSDLHYSLQKQNGSHQVPNSC